VRYVVDGAPFHETNCHCSICRRASGAPFVAWFTVASDAFQVVAGEVASFSSSGHGERSFCPRCGTPLTFSSRHFSEEIDITVASYLRAVTPADLPGYADAGAQELVLTGFAFDPDGARESLKKMGDEFVSAAHAL